jgi:hypothetical protein
MKGYGNIFLEKSLNILTNQTIKDFDIIISDHSKNNLIKDLCTKYKNELNINYYRNTENIGSSSANINNAIKKADGKLIKILFQDDFLFHNKSLEEIVKNFDIEKDNWLLTACIQSKDGVKFFRPFYPKYNNLIHLGKNTISSPSVLTIKNENPLLFDEKLLWLMDVDYYKRCYNKFGSPKIINEINVVNGIGSHQISNSIVNIFIKIKELLYILKKYAGHRTL